VPKWINFKELRRKLRFEDILRHYAIQVKRRGGRVTALCPLPGHPVRTNETPRTASLSINLARNIFQCFGCKASGNALEFACRMEGFDPSNSEQFRDAAIKVAEIFGIDAGRSGEKAEMPERDDETDLGPVQSDSPETPALPIIINAPLNFVLKDLDPGHPYLRERKFLPETVNHFGLGYCSRGLMKGRIAIPLHSPGGELVGYAGRITKDSMISDECPKYRFPGTRVRDGVRYEFRSSHLLYNLHRIRDRVLDLILVEGFASTWWLRQCGYWNVVALMGSSCSDEQADLIAAVAGRVWILSDGDDAGRLCADSVWNKLGTRMFCRYLKLEEGRQPTALSKEELDDMFTPLLAA
jgi:DNA primase